MGYMRIYSYRHFAQLEFESALRYPADPPGAVRHQLGAPAAHRQTEEREAAAQVPTALQRDVPLRPNRVQRTGGAGGAEAARRARVQT